MTAGPAAADSLCELFDNLSDPGDKRCALWQRGSVVLRVADRAGPRPDETTILHFRHLMERHNLGEGRLAEITQHLAT